MPNIDALKSNQLMELTRASQELSSTLNKSQVINLILVKAAEISGCAGTCLVLFHEMLKETPGVYSHGLSDEFAARIPALSSGPVRDTLAAQGFQNLDHFPGSSEEGIRSACCLSLGTNGSAKGLLYFFDFEESSLPEERIQGLQIFANYAASAVENALLYEEKERKIRQLNILNEAAVSLSTEPDIVSLYRKLVDHAVYLLKSETAFLILLHPKSNRIDQVCISGDLDKEALQFQPQVTGLLSDIMTTHAVLNLEPQDLADHHIDLPITLPHVRNILAAPIIHQEVSLGILLLANKADGQSFGKEDEDLLLTYGFQAALSIENTRLHEHTKQLSITDGLTNLFNHREFQDRLAAEVRRCIRYKRVFSLIMIDIDHFKTFNDTYGHPVGDKILKALAQIIRESIRDIDVAARYGGEEFVVILPETSYEHAQIVAERIRGAIFEKSFGRSFGNEEFCITVSVGISCFPEDALSREDLITKCDQALYFAKREGRNRVRRYDETLKAFIEKKEDHIEDLLKDAKIKVMRDLAAAVDAKNLFTRGHTDAVVHYAVSVAKALDLPPSEIESVRLGSILHDIGTVSIPEDILNKSGPLTAKERQIIQGHPQLGQLILQKASQLEDVVPAILHHHERWDGKGYPEGLKGNEIPLTARILCVVEAYQAMISDRSYRQRLSKEKAIEELRTNAGTQFDPEIVELFMDMVS